MPFIARSEVEAPAGLGQGGGGGGGGGGAGLGRQGGNCSGKEKLISGQTFSYQNPFQSE